METLCLETQVAWLVCTANYCIDGLIVRKEQQNPSKNQHDHCHRFLVHSIAIILGTDGDILSLSSGNVAEVAQPQVEGRGIDVEHKDPSDGAHEVPHIAHLQGGRGRIRNTFLCDDSITLIWYAHQKKTKKQKKQGHYISKNQPGTFPIQLNPGQAYCSCITANYSKYATIDILQKLISSRTQYSESADTAVSSCACS